MKLASWSWRCIISIFNPFNDNNKIFIDIINHWFFAAAIACETNGNKPITTDQLTKKISQVQKILTNIMKNDLNI